MKVLDELRAYAAAQQHLQIARTGRLQALIDVAEVAEDAGVVLAKIADNPKNWSVIRQELLIVRRFLITALRRLKEGE